MRTICGVDVSKKQLDSWVAGHYRPFANTVAGVEQLLAFCREHSVELVVMEASGGVEQAAFLALWKQGQPCAIANPRAVRSFADSMGCIEKTDRRDAEMIARYAHTKGLVATLPPSDDQRKLTALAARVRQISADISVQKQRLHTTSDPTALESLKDTIAHFDRQTKALAAEIAALITADPLWVALDKAIRSFKGLADRTSAVLIADLPELGTLPNKAITKLVGVAPCADDSGQRNGRRHIRGGRQSVRSILFLVADIARKYDKDLADFRDRLLAQGKEKMVVRIALARKLLVRLNARAREARAELALSA